MERRYALNFNSRDLRQMRVDCLVIGSGVAGLMTAYNAANAGLSVVVAVKDTLLDSNTNKAQGGIAVALGADDSLDLHLADTLIAGAGLCDEETVKIVVREGREEVKELMNLGAVFDVDEHGICLGREGCHCRNRVIHAKGDATGAEVARALLAAVKALPNIRLLEHHFVVDLLVEAGICEGALVLHDHQELEVIRANFVVLASGGLGQLYCHTTNPAGATGSGVAMAYRAGAEVMDMEFVQFHPTALAAPDVPNFLISEAVRGAGGVLRNAKGERFMPRYHELADLAPRDVVARAIYREMQAACADHVYLDVSGICHIEQHFPMITATCLEYGIDIRKEFIPVAPAAHYMMGGVKVDCWGESSIERLFCCGEVSCTGLHGANRLASNSLLEGLAYGKRIVDRMIAKGNIDAKHSEWEYNELRKAAKLTDIEAKLQELKQIMTSDMGLIRKQETIDEAERFFAQKREIWYNRETADVEQIEYLNMLMTSALICAAAGMRTESRGGHYRSDYPESLPLWRKHIIQRK